MSTVVPFIAVAMSYDKIERLIKFYRRMLKKLRSRRRHGQGHYYRWLTCGSLPRALHHGDVR